MFDFLKKKRFFLIILKNKNFLQSKFKTLQVQGLELYKKNLSESKKYLKCPKLYRDRCNETIFGFCIFFFSSFTDGTKT